MKILAYLFLGVICISCSNNNSVNSDIEIEFGKPYSIEIDSNTPTIEDGKLITKVAFSGCNNNLDFELRSNIKNSVTQLWLFKKTSNGDCDAYFMEELTFTLSQSMLSSSKIVLITPNNDEIQLYDGVIRTQNTF